ncbi:hypothetical protein ELQ90_00210 [Labedella phragmitis]|uniref:Uncharacterized protein n=1 Tax=Labedella phragmitis TaxID=2498849 RepID=A0A444PX28_9MICO|nr:hypothetical protein [Labedella phragmitis]RWZ52428.1 hypothetical protein ELQ90_00210 [Labedella phragmitis]
MPTILLREAQTGRLASINLAAIAYVTAVRSEGALNGSESAIALVITFLGDRHEVRYVPIDDEGEEDPGVETADMAVAQFDLAVFAAER